LAVIECVPNFSEGRRQPVLDALAGAVSGVAGVRLLDVQADPDHNRSVLTFVGQAPAVLAAAMAAVTTATKLIDMEQHQGSHPRIGATDVVPFVPVAGADLADCVELARRLGTMIADQLAIPVYLYGAAATSPERAVLADLRRGQYEGLKTEISSPERRPDFGPARMHPTAGATVVGARLPMVAYNVYLQGGDLRLAKAIARRIRERNGGLPGVQAIGLTVESGEVQVSMNLLDTSRTSIWRAFNEVARLAAEAGAVAVRSEVVGLVTAAAVAGSLSEAIVCPDLTPAQILESHLVSPEGPER
jgi:glutamate formiminotransferase